MQATVTGPGVVTFWWKVSSFTNSNRLIFYTGSSGSTEIGRISGEVDWQQVTFNVGNGSQVLRWTYQRSSSTSNGQERAWLDQVQFTPMPPGISTHPVSRSVDVGSTVSFNVVAAGSPPLSYQWHANGVIWWTAERCAPRQQRPRSPSPTSRSHTPGTTPC